MLYEFFEEYYGTKNFMAYKSGESYACGLKNGDQHTLLRIAPRLKVLIDENDPEVMDLLKRPATYFARKKRRSSEVGTEMEVGCEEPPLKKPKFSHSKEVLEELFGNFIVSSIPDNENLSPSYDEATERFLITCVKCAKKLSIGYKVSSKGYPIFGNTNIKKHKCFNSEKSKINEGQENDITAA